MNRGKVTQKKIAEKLGVSQAVVSMVLKGDVSSASEATRRRVFALARDQGYSMRMRQRMLPGEGKVVCVVVRSGAYLENPYHQRFLTGIQKAAEKARSMVSYYTIETPGDVLPKYLVDGVDGFIFTTDCGKDGLDSLFDKPVVFLNTISEFGPYDYVMPDNFDGINKAMRHLMDKGHRRIAYFGIREFGIHQKERCEAFVKLAHELALPEKDKFVFTPFRREFSLRDVERLVNEVLENLIRMRDRPTAIICEADLYALAFSRLALELGMLVPNDFSVIGFNNVQESDVATPRLTSVDQPMESMGESSFLLLSDKIEHPDTPNRSLRLGVSLKVRDSVSIIHH